jgi:two-component system, NarL family, sensor histidine kinase UhpB
VYLPVREALAPAAQILRALRRMQAGDLSVRMPRVRLQELDQIAQGFNHLAERLDATLQARKDLARRLMQVREEERRHLARELHDELGQSLASLRAEAAFVGAAAGSDPSELSASAQAIDHTTSRMMETLHGILGRLRPTGLEEFGLSASLEHLVDDGRRRSRGQCRYTLQIEGDPDRLSDDHAVSLYRIVQESLTNAAKHGRPTRIDVKLTHDPDSGAVDLRIEDDGQVENTLPQPASATPRHGLLGMHERVLALDGSLDIGTRIPHGVCVHVRLPGNAGPDPSLCAPTAPLAP